MRGYVRKRSYFGETGGFGTKNAYTISRFLYGRTDHFVILRIVISRFYCKRDIKRDITNVKSVIFSFYGYHEGHR